MIERKSSGVGRVREASILEHAYGEKPASSVSVGDLAGHTIFRRVARID
jgi:hypothetical protein